MQKLKDLFVKYSWLKYVVIVVICIGIGMFLTNRRTITEEVRKQEDVKTIKELNEKIKTVTNQLVVLRDNFKEHCITTVEISGKKVIDCKRERATESNASSQSFTQRELDQRIEEERQKIITQYRKEEINKQWASFLFKGGRDFDNNSYLLGGEIQTSLFTVRQISFIGGAEYLRNISRNGHIVLIGVGLGF